ncbi:RDD family protein [Halobacillus litoralis]|uniref:RDD family protein n=1 Tax=Halobacillus litoralis TaxID=45668 RepID=UPI001CD7C8C5|nr:RDD family protein [Halobacillus litoralis]MCA0971298.1 RDD family protein [Halobacillus litoralis]
MSREVWDIDTPEHVRVQVRLAGLGSRAAALLIDQALITLMQVGLLAIVVFTQENMDTFFTNRSDTFYAILIVIAFVLNWGYFFLCEWLAAGKTLGKRLIGIRVVDDQGGSPTTLSILIRNLLRAIDMLPIYYMVGIVMVFSHKKHKRLGDIMAGTLVVFDGHQRKKTTKLEKEMDSRDLEPFSEESLTLHAFQKKEWDLLKTYLDRYFTLSPSQKQAITYEVAHILFPKIGYDVQGKGADELENDLFRLYLTVRDDWKITPF